MNRSETEGKGAEEKKVSLKPAPEAGKAETKEKGTKSISVRGKAFSCKGFDITKPYGRGMLDKTEIWKCEDAPLGFVSKTSEYCEEVPGTMDGGGGSLAIKLVDLDVNLKIGDKEYKCWVYETIGEHMSSDTKTTTKTWYCLEIPGWVVKQESSVTSLRTGKGKSKSTVETLDCEVK
jgi:hypothetical protein